jgi:hypothetical protein
MVLKLICHSGKAVPPEAAFDFRRGGQRRGLGAGVLHGIVGEQCDHGVSVRPDFFDGSRKPFIDGAIHQSIGEPVHHHDRHGGEKQGAGYHAGSEFGSQHSQTALREKLQQVAHQDEGERHEEQEDERGKRGENHDFLIVSGMQEVQVEGRLRNQDGEQQKHRDRQQDDDLLAVGSLHGSGLRGLIHNRS